MLLQKPLRILHLVSSERWTGVAEPATSLARFQKAAGCQTWLVAVMGRSLEEAVMQMDDLSVVRDFEIPRSVNPLPLLREIRNVRAFIEANQVDVVHSHLIHDHWLAALAASGCKTRKPLVVRTVHRYEPMRRDPIHHWLFEKATDLVITVSSEQRDFILRAYPGLSERLKVIPGGVDPARFRPDLPGAASVRADLGEKPGARVAGIVAHLGYNRGHKWLVRVAPEVIETVPNSTIWIAGQGELKEWLRKKVREPQFHGRVVMAGYRYDDLPETYAAMDVSLLLGLGSEGSARAALEAMSSARPVIAVKKGALLDTISDGVDGLLVAENDERGLRDALVRLLGNPEESQAMGQRARKKILENFTEERRAQRVLESYEERLRTNRGE